MSADQCFPSKCAHKGPARCRITQDSCAHRPFKGECAQQKRIPLLSIAGPARALWRKASPRNATDEGLPATTPTICLSCLCRGTETAFPVRNSFETYTNWHICLCRDKRRRFSVLDSGAAHQSLPDASPPGFGGDPLFPLIRKSLNYKRNDGLI